MDADHQVVGVALSDESTTNGIPDLFVDEIVLPVEGLESHAVGWAAMRCHTSITTSRP